MVLYEVAGNLASSWYRPVSTSQCEKRIRRKGDAEGTSRLPMLRPAWDYVLTVGSKTLRLVFSRFLLSGFRLFKLPPKFGSVFENRGDDHRQFAGDSDACAFDSNPFGEL